MKPSFAVCIIARNEEQTLPRMLASLVEFRDRGGKVNILDTGSSDRTAGVAREWGCTVFEVGDKFRTTIDRKLAKKINGRFVVGGEKELVSPGDTLFDYSAARNYLALRTGERFLLTPDADEVYTVFDIDCIQEAIDAGAKQLEYEFVFSHDEHGNPAIRFRHGKAYHQDIMRWQGIVHEVLTVMPMFNPDIVQRTYLDESVIKLEHWQNEKTDRSGYLKGLALDCYLHPDNDRNSHYLGRELVWTDRPTSAIVELIRHIGMNRWPTEAAQSMIYIGDAYKQRGDYGQMLHWYHEAFLKEPNRREAPLRMAQYFFETNDPRKTAAYVSMALSIPQGSFYADQASHYREYPHELMYWALWAVGDREGSKTHWQKAREYAPQNPKYLADAFYYDPPQLSVVIPTLGKRLPGLARCLDSLQKTGYPRLETLVIRDEPRLGVASRLKEGISQAGGEWIVFGSDDIEFAPDALAAVLTDQNTHMAGFAAFNTGPVSADGGNACEHFIIRRDIIPLLGGEVFDTDFHHVGVDNLLWAKLGKLGRAYRCEKAVVNHYHFSKGVEMDETYELGWSEVEKDRIMLADKIASL